MMKFKKGLECGEPFGIYKSARAKHLWPKMIATFLETQIVVNLPERMVRFDTADLNYTANPVGEPLQISCKLRVYI